MGGSISRRDRSDRVTSARSAAQALVWFTVALPLFMSIAGLAIDGGVLLTARRQLQSVADGAARAGATRLDLDRLRASGGTDIQLDQTLAAEVAMVYLDERLDRELPWQAVPATQVDAGARRVHVVIQGTLRTAFLRIVHIDSAPVEAHAFADIQYGIRSAGGR
jgi:hypothetical protein